MKLIYLTFSVAWILFWIFLALAIPTLAVCLIIKSILFVLGI